MPSVSVIVPARDAAGTLEATLRGLGRQDRPPEEVIVVDNGSHDATAELADAHPAVTRTLRLARGRGPGAARNAGAAAAVGELLAFIDADCRPAPGWLAAGAAAASEADFVQGRVLPDPTMVGGPFDRTLAVTHAYGLYESANLFVVRSLFARLGGFPVGLEDPHRSGPLGAPFGEDVLFGWAARRAGVRTAFCLAALAYHAVFPRSPAGYVAERRRLMMFPRLVREVPELRQEFFTGGVFLTRRTRRLDLALAGGLAALAGRRPLPALAALPYLLELAQVSRRWGQRAPEVAVTELAADLVGFAALLGGSLAARSLVL